MLPSLMSLQSIYSNATNSLFCLKNLQMAKTQAKPAPKEVHKQKSPKLRPQPQGPSFLNFLIDKEQRLDWLIIGTLYLLLLSFLKLYYPYPQTETDSGNYILSALNGKINGYRPFGYSAFLHFFHGFSSDIRFVVTWQWLLTFLSVASFLFSVKFMFRYLPKPFFYTLAAILILNPSVLFMDAYLMSDSLFVSLTLFYITTGIWIIYSGGYAAIAANLLLLWWCMDCRYIGLFYPFLSAAAVSWALWKRFKWLALAAGLLPLLLLLFYYSNATDKMKEEFGIETFSAFGGWQKANNGVAVLPYVKVDLQEISQPQIKAIHQIVRQFPDSCFNTASIMATNFMWTRGYPGKQCLAQYIQQSGTPYLTAWVYLGTQMDLYGDFLQSRYKTAYFSHYILPNFLNIFKVYDIGEYKDFTADANTKAFFTTDRDNYQYKTSFFRPLTGLRKMGDALGWLALIASVIAGLLLLNKLAWTVEQKLVVAFMVVFIAAFCGASVLAAPINNFRYMMPVFYCQFSVPVLVLAALLKQKKSV